MFLLSIHRPYDFKNLHWLILFKTKRQRYEKYFVVTKNVKKNQGNRIKIFYAINPEKS